METVSVMTAFACEIRKEQVDWPNLTTNRMRKE